MEFIRRDTWALQRHFKMKRDFLLRELAALGITVEWHPTATFYIWANLSALPHPLDDCLVFLEECVKHKVIIVPGVFFDINPSHARNIRKSTCINFVRFSYGPVMKNLEIGVKQIGNMIEYWKNHSESADQYAEESFGGLAN
jgi:aspartate/methionine/tyrosine aminotransferase